ncbi:MAG: S8/S53 family peptidase, partial [Phycisphaerales bacterium]|nr:S8/S53 family peptidase [Phycisphaerales bacterium]
GAGANLGYQNVAITVGLYRETAAGSGVFNLVSNQNFNSTTDGSLINPADATTTNISGTGFARWANQTGGDNREYQVRVSVTSTGDAAFGNPGGSALGARAAVNFDSVADHRGLLFSANVEPANYAGNSRGAVGAAAARAQWGVSGAGPNVFGLFPFRATVAVIEPRVPLAGHEGLQGRLTILDNGGANLRQGEHPLAVAGIIAGVGPDEARSGVAPGARLLAASIGDWGGTIAAAQAAVNNVGVNNPLVVNYSASDGSTTVESLDRFLTVNPRVTWVAASGNEQTSGPWPGVTPPPPPSSGNVETPDYAYNIISVGALERNFNRPTDFSSTTLGNQPSAPHIMAPGEDVMSLASRDLNNNGHLDDHTRTFLGNDWNQTGGATVGSITGTSFAAPHVAGTVALLHDYALQHNYRVDSVDHRVMKAVILAGASTWGITDRAGNGWRQTVDGAGTAAAPFLVHRSLNENLGSGMLNVPRAVGIFAGGEILNGNFTTANAPRNQIITGPGAYQNGQQSFWDFETVGGRNGGIDGTVDYILPSQLVSSQDGASFSLVSMFDYLRACLTWDATTNAGGTAYSPLSNLELRLYADNLADPNGMAGFDPNNPNADTLLARTDGAGENVRLFDLTGFTTSFTQAGDLAQWNGGLSFYLQVRNLSDTATTYGIALTLVPAPSGAGLLVLVGLYAGRRRRA